MLEGRSCVVPRLFCSTCETENDWSYMKYMLDLDIKNGKRPMEIDAAEDEHHPRKCTKMLESCHIVETVCISFQQPKDSDDSQMNQKTIEPLNDGDSMDSSDSGIQQSDEEQHAGDSG
ncbi:hypothetical protein TSUD_220950 [Trifolium subterraneum]|uniref:Uncharacterized protein n=1 Tax=Trifolium subterraneum TaxID=3900 RepID=A0A2Z6MIB9_TRISU|nr:hypothetical protein TSUD_220950 [Trifolium subterraneum]